MGMPRKQFHEGYWYHVYARSLPELCLFESVDERSWFISKLDEIFSRRQVTVGALCLLDTHYHALVKMGPVRLDRALNGLHMSYAKRINNLRDRRGSVFEKHPGTDIVLDDSYLLQLVPYIHNNPVEAGIVEDPRNYDWHTDGLYRGDGWRGGSLDCWEWPPYFDGPNRQQVYLERMGEEYQLPRSDEGYVGNEEEWKGLEKRDEDRQDRFRDRRGRPTMKQITRDVIGEKNLSLDDLKASGRSQPETRLRQQAMVKMYEAGWGPTEIGEFFQRDKGAVLYAVRKEKGDEN